MKIRESCMIRAARKVGLFIESLYVLSIHYASERYINIEVCKYDNRMENKQ